MSALDRILESNNFVDRMYQLPLPNEKILKQEVMRQWPAYGHPDMLHLQAKHKPYDN